MTLSSLPSKHREKLELHAAADWEKHCMSLDLSEGDFQTEV